MERVMITDHLSNSDDEVGPSSSSFMNPRISSQGFYLGHAKHWASSMHAIRMFAIKKKVNSDVHASENASKRPRQDEKNWIGTKVGFLNWDRIFIRKREFERGHEMEKMFYDGNTQW